MKNFMLGVLVLMACQNLLKAGDMPSQPERMRIPEPRTLKLETQVLEAEIREIDGKLGLRSAFYGREIFMSTLRKCRGLEGVDDFVTASTLAAIRPDLLARCPNLAQVGLHLNMYEKCILKGFRKAGLFKYKPSSERLFMSKTGSVDIITDPVRRVIVDVVYACKHPKEFPDAYEGIYHDGEAEFI